MKINSSEFIKSAVKPDDFPELNIPEIAFVGRSNVGKSSLINKLLSRRSLAKTSSTPGKTRLINFFLINNDFAFVDLPGYGYAKVSKSERSQWGKMMETYFSIRKELKGVVLLQDIRRDRAEADDQMREILTRYNIPIISVLTKADKFSNNQRIKRLKEIEKGLPTSALKSIPFSATSGLGLESLWSSIADVMGNGEK